MGAIPLLAGCYPWYGPDRHEAAQPVEAPPCRDPVLWYADADGDGYGDPEVSVPDCEAPEGYVDNASDCLDSDPGARPGAVDIPYDGIDQDCIDGDVCDVDGDGLAAFGVPACEGIPGLPATDCNDFAPSIGEISVYPDGDGDGYGDATSDPVLCEAAGADTASDATDCDDSRADIHPGAPELVTDGEDRNCDGVLGVDRDGDGYASIGSGGDDCNDDPSAGGASAHPGAADFVDNGLDDNCDGIAGVDEDGDGWASLASGGPDCDDDPATGADVNPGATEVCNGVDDDCFNGADLGAVDELFWHEDADGDGYGFAPVVVLACEPPPGWVGNSEDCDDADPNAYPGADDLVSDGIDSNCDGTPGVDADGDGWADLASGGGDCADSDPDRHPAAAEIPYDGIDQDCNGGDLCDVDGDGEDDLLCGGLDCDDADPGVTDQWYYPDADGDGYGDEGAVGTPCIPGGPGQVPDDTDCNDADPGINPGEVDWASNYVDNDCDGTPGVDQDGDGWASVASAGWDCDDANPDAYPGAVDFAADGVDSDCDGTPGVDTDTDGHASLASGGDDCDDTDPATFPGAPDDALDAFDTNCDGIPGVDADGDGSASIASNGADCDDTDPLIRPGITDFVSNGIDNDCDGVPGTDRDQDAQASLASGGPDCDDSDPDVFAGAPEQCNGVVDDCDSATLPPSEIDDDGDGYVECGVDLLFWDGPPIAGGGDCDDGSNTVYPGAPEVCDGIVDDCSGGTLPPDEIDDDGDGRVECSIHPGGWQGAPVLGGDDCDDANPMLWPYNWEICDGIRTDCNVPALPDDEIDDDGDGYVDCVIDPVGGWLGTPVAGGQDCDDLDRDEHPGVIWFDDLDRDRHGDPSFFRECDRIDPFSVLSPTDCDDTDATVFPGAPELCDGLLNDCGAPWLPDDESDLDGDGYVTCTLDPAGWLGDPITGGDDCDDRRADIWSGGECDACPPCTTTVWTGLQAAIDAASPGDTICVMPGVYSVNLNMRGTDLCLRGTQGAANTTLDGGALDSVIRIPGGNGPSTVIEGFTITNGFGQGAGIRVQGSATLRDLVLTGNDGDTSGGGLSIEGPETHVRDVVLDANLGYLGAGINVSGAARIERTDFLNHSTPLDASGIYVQSSGAVAVYDSTFFNNDGYAGGAVSCGGVCRFERTTFDQNDGWGWGGGINVAESGSTTLVDVAFLDNVGHQGAAVSVYGELVGRNLQFVGNSCDTGGAIFAFEANRLELSNTAFVGNDAFDGGAIYVSDSGPLDMKLRNTRFVGNSGGGGALTWSGAGNLRIENGTFVGNSSSDAGGVFLIDGAAVQVFSSAFSDNDAPTGSVASVSSGEVTFRSTNFWNNGNTPFDGVPSPLGTMWNTQADPLYLDAMGTDPTTWDLHLGLASPLVDAGDPKAWFDDPDGDRADMGHYSGLFGGSWDADHDGYPEWWQPGPYDPTLHPALGLDCDDADPLVFPGSGC